MSTKTSAITTTRDYTALKKQFSDFSLRLDARIAAFREDASFAKTHGACAARLRKGQARVEARLEAAARRAEIWEATKTELRSDLNALIGDFDHLEESLDAPMISH
ncbi:hypothetical protein [uncultured Rhodoblastus sp.]|uniref:hypothetical protein n=1 Tax=uncultured Rhodoblastus sp. TaxID=543037 RepID=UPI0025E86EED|nr:hypothetical protein [uncultured Rhodoblastus sp.]